MADSLLRIKNQPIEIWMVKLADRITNLQPPPKHWDQNKIDKYREEAIEIHSALKKGSRYLAARLMQKIYDYLRAKSALQYGVYVDDNFKYMDESERDFADVFSSAEDAVARAEQIVDQSIRWEKLQEKDPYDPEALYGRYTDFGDDPFIRSNDPDCHFSAWSYAKGRCIEIAKEDINDKKLYDF